MFFLEGKFLTNMKTCDHESWGLLWPSQLHPLKSMIASVLIAEGSLFSCSERSVMSLILSREEEHLKRPQTLLPSENPNNMSHDM